ncbi:MAG: M23 family metallopeptidase [Microbacteriaceae bacterium]
MAEAASMPTVVSAGATEEASQAAGAADGAPERTNPIPLPVLILAHESRPAPPLVAVRGRQPEHASKHLHRFGKPLFSLLAMAFAVAMAVATSVPANAMLSSASLASGAGFSTTAHGAGQSMLGDDHASAGVVTRDNVDVKSQEQVYSLGHIQRAGTFTNDPRGTIQWPFPVGVPISDWFGARSAPTAGATTFHEGVDFAPGNGTPIQAIADGVVRTVDLLDNSGYGVHVIIDHMINGKLVSSVYGHMQVGSVRVTEGQAVKVTDIVGLVGSTGVSTGPHLHFEIHLNGTEPVDPYAWLKANAN